MTIDIDAARRFLTGHGRVLDRRRFEVLTSGVPPEGALGALAGYRNPDGGYGWGLEPDLRTPVSQPASALHAFEVLEEAGAAGAAPALDLAGWLDQATFPDGGVPFAMAVGDPTACAPFWVEADPEESSLQITAAVTAAAQRAAREIPALRETPWLRRSTAYCFDAVEALTDAPPTLVLSFALSFADAAAHEDRAAAAVERLTSFLPAEGRRHVEGGLDDEYLFPLDFSPYPGLASRAHLADGVVEKDLDRLESLQGDDGGWPVTFANASPAAELEWRGYTTVRAVAVLVGNGRG